MQKLTTLFVFFLMSVFYSFSQDGKDQPKEIIAIGAGAGVLTFHGDVGGKSLVGAYTDIRSAYSISAEKNLNKYFSLSLNFLKGKVAADDKASDNIQKRSEEHTSELQSLRH